MVIKSYTCREIILFWLMLKLAAFNKIITLAMKHPLYMYINARICCVSSIFLNLYNTKVGCGSSVVKYCSLVIVGLSDQAQVAMRRASGVKQFPNLSWEFTRCGDSCRRKQLKDTSSYGMHKINILLVLKCMCGFL